jgi:hypothetical protein
MDSPEISRVIWIDKSVYNNENQGYKKTMEEKYHLQVDVYDDAKNGIEAIKRAEIYSPIYIITSGSIYPEFYKFFKSAVTYIKNLPVQIIFTSSKSSFEETHKYDEIGEQIGKFYNLGGITDLFSQVENFIVETNKKLKEFKTESIYTSEFQRDFSGLQTFTYLDNDEKLYLPSFFQDIIEEKKINYSDISTLINFMLTNFGNDKMSDLLKGMILFNDIPEPILSKFFARAYTLESPFYDIMNKSLMKKNYYIYSTYIKLLYKGIVNKSYEPKTDCTLYRGTKLEKFEIEKLKDMLKKKSESKDIPIIYSTSFLSFSNNDEISKGLGSRRLSTSKNRSVIIKLNPLSFFDEGKIMKTNGCLYEISFYHDENEVLFFPFSSFELVNVEEYDNDMTLIEFNYSLRFKNKINGDDSSGCNII